MNIRQRTQSGFTLLELLLVLLIIGLLAGYVAPRIINKGDHARKITALQQINALELALKQYYMENGNYPSNEQGLKALIKKPDIDPIPKNWKRYWSKRTLPKDPWGRHYQYRNPGQKEDIDIYSMGQDKDSDEDDIGNWEKQSNSEGQEQE